MFNFIKKLLGYPTDAEKEAAKAPYKLETPVYEAPPSMPVGQPPQVPEETAPVVTTVVESKPTAMKAKKKPANKKPVSEKKTAPKKPGRKPKAKPQAV